MEDLRYSQESIAVPYRPIFEQLLSTFPGYEVWQRHENFRRCLSAGVVNRSLGVAVTVEIVRGGRTRTQLLTAEELTRITKHLASDQEKDLSI